MLYTRMGGKRGIMMLYHDIGTQGFRQERMIFLVKNVIAERKRHMRQHLHSMKDGCAPWVILLCSLEDIKHNAIYFGKRISRQGISILIRLSGLIDNGEIVCLKRQCPAGETRRCIFNCH